jgi:hypothetical protein
MRLKENQTGGFAVMDKHPLFNHRPLRILPRFDELVL